MERMAIVSILSVLLVQLTAARATAEGDYKKICRVSENLRVLDDSADANSCRTIAVDSQAQALAIILMSDRRSVMRSLRLSVKLAWSVRNHSRSRPESSYGL
jgi:hypothetical protein